VYEGRAITGNVDVSFGIGPLYYNFIDIRYIGEPVLRGRLIEPSRNVTIINNTVNVTNITVNNTTVINNGPDLTRVNQFSTRPIPRLTLQRETNINNEIAGHRGNLNRVNGNTLMVAAPAVKRSPQKITPRQVKAKVDKPNFEKGWKGINNRQQVEQAMEKENAKKVPPPTFQPQKGRKDEASGNADNAGNAGNGRALERNHNEQSATNPERAATEQGQQNELRRRGVEERKAPVEQQAQQSERPKEERNQERPEQMSGADAQPPDRAQRPAEQVQESQRAERQSAEQAQQAQQQRQLRAERARQLQNVQRAQPPQPPPRPDHAQRPQENRSPEQARSREQQPQQQQSNQNPNDHQNKKKRPADEPTPQS
jgi:hypothetical protein